MLRGERLAVVLEGKEHIGAQKILQGDVGGVALFGKHENKLGTGFSIYAPEDFGEQNAFPEVVEAAPTGDAVKIAGDFGLRQGAKFVPGQAQWIFDEPSDLEIPGSGIEDGYAAVVEHRPFEGQGLVRGKAPFCAGLFLFGTPTAIVSKNGHPCSLLDIRVSHGEMVSARLKKAILAGDKTALSIPFSDYYGWSSEEETW